MGQRWTGLWWGLRAKDGRTGRSCAAAAVRRGGTRTLGLLLLIGLAAGAILAPPAAALGAAPPLEIDLERPEDGPIVLRLLSPEAGLPVPVGDLWLAVGVEAPAGLRRVRFQWESPDGTRAALEPEVAGASARLGSAWYEVTGVDAGTYRLVVEAEDALGGRALHRWEIQVVGDLASEPELRTLEEGLWVRRRSAQAEVDRRAQDGTLWRLLEARYAWRTATDPVRAAGSWQGTLGRLSRPILLRALVEDVPDGFLAQGVRAYEEVRGASYWWDARLEPAGTEVGPRDQAQGPFRPVGRRAFYGPTAYEPDREAAGWPGFLAVYGSHPAADDAAYRLGRAHELLAASLDGSEAGGERARHLVTAAFAYLTALELPDGDMMWDARNRLLYLLDAVATPQDLEAMARRLASEDAARDSDLATMVRPSLQQDLAVAISYALAVRHLAAGAYAAASDALGTVLHALPAQGPWDPLALRTPETRAALERQAEAAERLAELRRQAASSDRTTAAEAAYQESALIYHDPLLFHLALWHGQRADYLAFGHVFSAAEGGEPDGSLLKGYAARHNTYVRALGLFDALLESDPPEPWRERALFSRGMSLYHLLHYGSEVHSWRPPDALRADLVRSFERFAALYPAGSMADDALLMVGVYGNRPEVLRELVERYPNGDKRPVAERLLQEME